MTLHAAISGTADTLTWLAFVGIVIAAIVLYWPRRFSGPLTEHERSLVRGRLGRRSFVVALVTPLSAVIGLWLLLPPLVQLEVPGGGGRCEPQGGVLTALSTRASTAAWVDAVRCQVDYREKPAEAILAAAADGFRVSCTPPERSPEDLSIELSIVEVAARAFTLTSVTLDPGPRRADPDPWDIMERTLRSRGVATCSTRTPGISRDGEVLRLGPTIVTKADDTVELGAVVQGKVCGLSKAELVLAEPTARRSCKVEATNDCEGEGQRVLKLRVQCDDWTGGTVLRVGALESRVHFDRNVQLRFEDSQVASVFVSALRSTGFVDDLRRRGLGVPEVCERCSPAAAVEVSGADIVVRGVREGPGGGGPAERLASLPSELRHGPFSWSGITPSPHLRCARDEVIVEGAASLVQRERRDPTATYALMATIVWAAKAVTNSSCADIRRAVEVDLGAHPLLSAEEVEEAVAAMRRGRETLGLLCLGLSLVGLAMGLRRSVR